MSLLLLGMNSAPALALAQVDSGPRLPERVDQLAATLDMVWVLVAAALVMLMQVGFMLLEAGSVRTKNAISVAQKNMLDFCFATLAFAFCGFGIAFGVASGWLPFGTDGKLFALNGLTGSNSAFFIFQVVFCGTAATIVSGAVAERMRLRAYILLCVVLSALVYPIFTHWAWGNALAYSRGAFLANRGFVDFAGSTVVHGTGAWFALAACLVLGAREGRFEQGAPIRIGGHSAVLSSTGALFLLVGWIGFNGGSTLAASDAVPEIILNTVLAGSAGGIVGYGLTWFAGAMLPERSVNGMVGGLVAVTAGCHLLSPGAAVLIGLLGGIAANGANMLLERRFGIDDAVGAIGAHGVAGVIGTLGLALLAPVDALPTGSRLAQFVVQAQGTSVSFLWSFGLGLTVMLLMRKVLPIRVTFEEEQMGLNVAEHGARLGTDHLQAAVETMLMADACVNQRLVVPMGDDNESLTVTLNSLMDKLQNAEHARSEEVRAAWTREEAQRFAVFGDLASESIFLIHQGRIRSANAAAEALFKMPSAALCGKLPEELVHPRMRWQMARWLSSGDDAVQQVDALCADGSVAPVELRFRHVEFDGRTVMILRMTDLSEREEAHKRIYHLAMHDPLTDLPNRELFKRRLDEAIASQHTGMLTALLLIDIDRFKDINDLHGHPAGDVVLTAIAERLLSGVRSCDTVARLGGDEFAVVHTRIAFPNQALDLAYRTLQLVSDPVTLPSGTVIRPRASIGIAITPLDAEGAQDLIHNADLALYAAKERGRNGYQRYTSEMGRVLRLRQELEEDLSNVIDRGELELHYQPRVDTYSGELAGFEALVRWKRHGRLIPPDDFISVAEESGLIVPIGAWVVREACHTAMARLGGTSVSVNISARQFHDPDLVSTIADALAQSGLKPSRLELEITETVLIDDDAVASRVLRELRQLGVCIALDDFGTGYSSLSHLTRFTFDTIKIDRSFIQADDEKTWHVIRSVLKMASEMGTSVVAEGVETEEQRLRLAHEGCRQIQGFLIARPLPVDAAAIYAEGRGPQGGGEGRKVA